MFGTKNKCKIFNEGIVANISVGKYAKLSNETDEGISILEAVKSSDVNVVEKVLKNANVDLQIKDADGNTALHAAVESINEKTVKLLLDRDADGKSKNGFLRTFFDKVFLRGGNFIDIRNGMGNTALHLACGRDEWKIVKILLERGADYTIKNKNGTVAYEMCHFEKDNEAFLYSKPNALTKKDKLNLLVTASCCNWLNVIDKLIEFKVNVNCVNLLNGFQGTPLMAAARNGHNLAVEKLLNHGADVNARNKKDNNFTALHYACRNNNLESVKLLFRFNPNLEDLRTPIFYAFPDGHDRLYLETVKYLHEKGVDVNFNCKSLLRYCARNNNHQVADYLIDRGFNVDAIDEENRTPLLHACWMDNEQVVEVLLKSGADVNFNCGFYGSALHYTCWGPNKYYRQAKCNIVKLLLSYNADTTTKDAENLTPLELANYNKLQHIVDILENHNPNKSESE